jgi:hypothetical protein
MASATNQKVHTSATVLLQVGGKNIGVGQSATATEQFNVQPVSRGFGSIMPLEHVATEWSANIEMDKFYLRNHSLAQMGLAASGSGILAMEPIDIAFIDSLLTSQELTTFLGCTLITRSFTVTHNNIVGERATWWAMDVKNDTPMYSHKVTDYMNQ